MSATLKVIGFLLSVTAIILLSINLITGMQRDLARIERDKASIASTIMDYTVPPETAKIVIPQSVYGCIKAQLNGQKMTLAEGEHMATLCIEKHTGMSLYQEEDSELIKSKKEEEK
jgi:hypothetical protein